MTVLGRWYQGSSRCIRKWNILTKLQNLSYVCFFFFFFFAGINYEPYVAPNTDISVWFWATSTASFRERLLDFRSCWIVFIHVVRQHTGGLLKFAKGSCSDLLGIYFVWHSCNVVEQGGLQFIKNLEKVVHITQCEPTENRQQLFIYISHFFLNWELPIQQADIHGNDNKLMKNEQFYYNSRLHYIIHVCYVDDRQLN